jgi:hypothetical protein
MANTGPGPSNPGASTDASTNPVPVEEHDPKLPFDTYASTQSSPPGYYPTGFYASGSDNEDFNVDADDPMETPHSILPPRMGTRLSDQPPERRGFGIMQGR